MAHPAKLVFFGTDAFSDTALHALLDNGYHVSLVVTKPDAPAGRKRILTPPAVKKTAQSQNIPVLQPQHAVDLVDALQGRYTAGIVVSYGKILPASILSLFPGGLINIHASLLPKYRGSSPIEAALLNGDPATGVTLMQLDAGMDTGPIYAQAEYQIDPTDNQATLYDKLASIGADLLVRELDAILDGSLIPQPQDSHAATTVHMIRKSDGDIDWTKSAVQLERQIKAFSVWPGSKTTVAGEDITITAAAILQNDDVLSSLPQISPNHGAPGTPFKTEAGELAITCGQGALIVSRLKPAGKREMTGKEFLAGHPVS